MSGVVVADHQDGGSANGTIQGEVTNEIGEPIEDATVNVTEYDDHLETTTDANGVYEIENVPHDDQTIAVTASDYEKIGGTVTVSTTNSPVTKDFELERTTGTISGTAESNGGEIDGEIPEVDIEIKHDNQADQRLIEEIFTSSTKSDKDDGSYEFEVPTGDVSLTATQDGFDEFSNDSISVSANSATTVDLDMQENLTTVDGTVENTDGDSISGATVVVDGNADIWPGLGALDAQTNSSGEYEIQHVPVSTTGESRTITASANTFDSDEESTEISARGKTVNFELSHEGGLLEGTVEDEHGNQLRGIDVEVDDRSTRTGDDGSYRIDEIPYGTHKVTIDHPDYAEETISTEITGGDATTENVVLERTSDVQLEIDSVSPDFWQTGDEVTVTYSFDENVSNTVDFSVEEIVSPTTLNADYGTFAGETTFTVPERGEINDGQYTVELSALGTTQTESFEVSNVYDSEQVAFSETDYQSPAGDFVEVSISTGDLDEAYILIGGDREVNQRNLQNHLDVLHVSGDATFVINTRLVGTERDSEDVYIPVEGEVTSYAHENGAGNPPDPSSVFDGVSFEDENGNEIARTLAEFRTEMDLSSRGSPLQAGRYRLVAGGSGTVIEREDSIPGFRQPVARSNLVLTQPEIGEVTTYTLPPAAADQVEQFNDDDEPMGTGDLGSLLDSSTETDRIARGDRILIEVQSVGMHGALMDTQASENAVVDTSKDGPGAIPAEWVKTLLTNHEGVHIELSDSNLGGPNHGGSTLQFENVGASDLYILPDDTADQWNDADAIGTDPLIGGFYVIIDTRGTDPFDRQPRDGDELTFDIAYESPPGERYEYKTYDFSSGAQPDPFDPAVSEVDGLEHFPYFGSSDTTVSANDSFVFEDPYIDYGETTLENELVVAAEADGVISGETNIAPGSRAEMQLIASNRPDPKTITIEDVEISEDRTFEVTEDFSQFEPGERIEVEFYSQGRLIENRLLDKRGVRVVDDLDNPSAFEIENMTEQAEVTRGQRLSAIEATIANTGEIGDRQVVAFDINNETVREQSVTLERGEEATLDLSEQFVALPVGEHSFTVRTEDDERTGQLVVTKPDSENETEINSIDTDSATLNESPEESESEPEEPDEPTESDPEGLVGLFGIRSRDVAVAATVTGAMHILGQWT